MKINNAGLSRLICGYFLLFLLCTSDPSIILENILVGGAYESTLLAEKTESGSKVLAVLSLNRDLALIGD